MFFGFFLFRDTLKKNYNTGQYFLEISLDDMTQYDEPLAEKLTKDPTLYLPVV